MWLRLLGYFVIGTRLTVTVLRRGLTVNRNSAVSFIRGEVPEPDVPLPPPPDGELLDEPPPPAPPTCWYAVTIASKVNNWLALSWNLIVRLPLTSFGLNCSSDPS